MYGFKCGWFVLVMDFVMLFDCDCMYVLVDMFGVVVFVL